MGRAVSIQGIVTPPAEAKVSVYDRGFLYGDGVFETLRTYRGVPFALEEHLARLEASARLVGIRLPVTLDVLAREIADVIAAAGDGDCSVRIMISRGEGPMGLDPSHAASPLRVILVEPLAPMPAAIYRSGVACVTERTERAADAAPGAKVTNYLAGMLALQRAQARGAHEALLLDASGHVLEGVTSNFFLVIEGALLTAKTGSILEGITRAYVLRCAASLGIEAREGTIGSAEIEAASEAFLTSSLREILPVVRVDDTTIGDGSPGSITRRLHVALREVANVADEPLPWVSAGPAA